MELLLGAGSSRTRRLARDGRGKWHLRTIEGPGAWSELVTLDHNADHQPNVLHDLEELPYPFNDDTFDEIHAYEVLEHTGQLGDWRFFFAQFSELWRILKPRGVLAATCPSYRSPWAFGDPSHKRVLTSGSLVFLDQAEYRRQVGVTAMSDFRFCYRADFLPVAIAEDDSNLVFVLEAVKPSRWLPVLDAA